MRAAVSSESADLRAGGAVVVTVANPGRFDAVMEEPASRERRDLGCMVCIASACLTVFTALWIMLPA